MGYYFIRDVAITGEKLLFQERRGKGYLPVHAIFNKCMHDKIIKIHCKNFLKCH